MVKVEAVVIRERVEPVIDAVEEQAGHIGVTVVEAVGHGRQRGITHESASTRARPSASSRVTGSASSATSP